MRDDVIDLRPPAPPLRCLCHVARVVFGMPDKEPTTIGFFNPKWCIIHRNGGVTFDGELGDARANLIDLVPICHQMNDAEAIDLILAARQRECEELCGSLEK